VRFPLCTCCRHYPGAAAGCIVCSLPQSYQPSPIRVSGQPAHRPFRGLLGVHSHYGLHTRTVTVFRDSFTEGFNYFVTSIVAPVASGWSILPGGIRTHWKAPPYHGAPLKRTFRDPKVPRVADPESIQDYAGQVAGETRNGRRRRRRGSSPCVLSDPDIGIYARFETQSPRGEILAPSRPLSRDQVQSCVAPAATVARPTPCTA
jgi:hypothetical protein